MKTSHLIIASALAAVVAVAGIVALYDATHDPKEVEIEYMISSPHESMDGWDATFYFDLTDVPKGTAYYSSVDPTPRSTLGMVGDLLHISEHTDTFTDLFLIEWYFEYENYEFTMKLVDRL